MADREMDYKPIKLREELILEERKKSSEVRKKLILEERRKSSEVRKKIVEYAEENKMIVLGGLDELGDPEWFAPDDFFMNYGVKLSDWLQVPYTIEEPDFFTLQSYVNSMNFRMERAKLAFYLYSAFGDKQFREYPRVIENYTPTDDYSGDLERYFIFKEDNNGTTYRFQDLKADSHRDCYGDE